MLDKAWGIVFLFVPVFSVAIFFAAPGEGWWFPSDISTHGHGIDQLFNLILGVTGVAFVATQAILVYTVFKCSGRPRGQKGWFIHTHHGLEYGWTIATAAILAFVALIQIPVWAKVKYTSNSPDVRTRVDDKGKTVKVPHARVTARQFEWRITYPGPDGVLDTPDDVTGVNQLHVPVAKPILIELTSQDVLHDFFLPNLRIKQDAVPGMVIPVWFETKENRQGTYELVCAELCGWGHYKMKGMVVVHPAGNVDLEKLEADIAALTAKLSGMPADDTTRRDVESERAGLSAQLAELREFEGKGLHLTFDDWMKGAIAEENRLTLASDDED